LIDDENCKGCGDSKPVTEEAIQRMIDRIEGSPLFLRVNDATYEQRLEACRACPGYVGKECTMCGCIMEIMAKLQNTRCLHPDGSQWETA
jgi:hypothetical protein